MSYNPNIPNATDLLSNSQGQLRTNFQTANTSFGIDHYAFADTTPNNGFHNKVTTPLIVGSAHPATTTNPLLYAMQDSANIGTIQYSRGPSNAVPTPITSLHSGTAPIIMNNGDITNILDFTGITRAMMTLYVWNASDTNTTRNFFTRSDILWHLLPVPTPFFRLLTDKSTSVGNGLVPGGSGNILQVQNQTLITLNNVHWTLIFHRIDP